MSDFDDVAGGLDALIGQLQQLQLQVPRLRVLRHERSTGQSTAIRSGVRYSFGRYRLGATYLHQWFFIPTITDSITKPPSNVRGHGSNNIMTLTFEAMLGGKR